MNKRKIGFVIGFVLLMWLIYLLGFFLKIDLGILGIYPRAINSLLGIITSPFIHGSFEHLIF
ncbi:MAG: hypothetical protein R2801_09590 [Chitinophagales bacterium]